MSDNISQNELYKNKCLYVGLNILLSKIQKLEKKVAALESINMNMHKLYNKTNTTNNTQMLMNRISRLETKLNEQNKLINQYTQNNNTSSDATLTAELDNYLQDIDDIMEFQINNTPDLLKLNK